ncbi:hypothetical protein [Pleionea sp. CnH1-48]|uniref:hypothetical protein n=1 Tax=Pleionea sp. CnH1-48 TaxID=2954494 RepID=UPI002096BEBC|nr:hypothetical protein [Pleionea sp. CnH1-48]MCO7226068.1 hypothetical protein [Pleionea sp. CnH1-48]
MLKKSISIALSVMAMNMAIAQKATDQTPMASSLDVVKETRKSHAPIIVSSDIMNVIAEWQGEHNPSYREVLIAEERHDLIESFLEYGRLSRTFITLSSYVKQHAPNQWEYIQDHYSEEDIQSKSEVRLFDILITNHSTVFDEWQKKALSPSFKRFADFAKAKDPESYYQWEERSEIPSKEVTLYQYAEEHYPEMVEEMISTLRPTRPWLPSPGGPRGNDCECTVVTGFQNLPTGYQQFPVWEYKNKNNNPSKHKKIWKESFYASHYGEAYVYGRGHQLDLADTDVRRTNKSEITTRILCEDENGYACSGCSANLDIYALYGSNLQVNNDQWSWFGGHSEASAKDSVNLKINLNNGYVKAVDKSLILSQSNKQEFKSDKLMDVINDAVSLYKQINKDKDGNITAGDLGEYGKIAAKTYKDVKSMVKITGKKGTSNEQMLVEYNTNTDSDAATHTLLQNRHYSAEMTSTGELVYSGKGRHRTNNSYYASSSALAIAVSGMQCTTNVTVTPKNTGCWVHSSVYRSPYHNNSTPKDSVAQFLQYNLNKPNIDTSAHFSCVSP